MTINVHRSTGFCNKANDNEFDPSPAAVWTIPQLRVYSGTAPAATSTPANEAETGTLLNVITLPSYAGLTFGASASGVKAKSGTWAGVAGDTDAGTGSSPLTKITSGTATAGYWRLVNKADTGLSSTSLPRLQGDCGPGMPFVFSSLTITFAATTTVSSGTASKLPS